MQNSTSRRAWYVRQRGQVAGPFRSGQIRAFAAQGKIGPQTELSVCEAGRDPEVWFAAKTVPELKFLPDETLLPPEVLRGGTASVATAPPPQPPPLPTGQTASRRQRQFSRNWGVPLCIITVAFCSGFLHCDPGPFGPKDLNRNLNATLPDIFDDAPFSQQIPFANKRLTTEQVVAQAEHGVVRVQGLISSGSGFYVAENWVVTNAHVLEGEFTENLRVIFPSQTQWPPAANLQLRYIDYERDLAILQTDTRRKPLRLADGAAFHRGEDVVVIGSPTVSSLFVLGNAVSRGVVSSETTIDGQRFLQLGASVNPGNSGGPVLNSSGEVVGMVARRANTEEALTFCIPADEIAQAIQSLQQGRPQALVQSWHRARVCYDWLYAIHLAQSELAGSEYDLMSQRAQSGQTYQRLEATPTDVMSTILAPTTAEDFWKQLNAVATDENLPQPLRDDLAVCWNSQLEIAKLYRSGPAEGTWWSTSSWFIELTKLHEDLVPVRERINQAFDLMPQ